MEARLARMERQIRRLQVYAGTVTILLTIGALTAFHSGDHEDQIIRARGLIIVDNAGRERILLGAPIPEAASRLRTNLTRVDSAWARRFPPNSYMKYYGTYRNALSGLLVLDTNGVDRIMLGDSLPDPNIGRRAGSQVGILINDRQGFERSGYGLLTVRGRDRVVLGLDTDQGTEGVTLSVRDSGRLGLQVNGRGFSGFFGAAPASDSLGGIGKEFAGALLHEDTRTRRITP